MRRTASEVLRSLERRVARLERVAKSDGPVMNAINSSNAYHHPKINGTHTTAMLFDPSSKKMWEAVLDGNVVHFAQGEIGGTSKKTKKKFESDMEAEDHFNKVLSRKLNMKGRETWTSAFNAKDGEESQYRKHHGPSEVMYGRYPTSENLQERYRASALPALREALDELEGMAIPALMENDTRNAGKHIQQALVMANGFNGYDDLSTSLYAGILSAKQNLMSGLSSDQVARELSDLVDQIRTKM